MPRLALLANCPSVSDDSVAATDSHIFSLEALYTPYKFRDGWPNQQEAFRWLDQFSSIVEPGFIESIQQWRVLTPADYERDFHLSKGHATSFSGGPLAAFLGREPELTRYHTPVKGLFLTGAATFPGAGVWGSSGRSTATTIISSMG